MTRGLPLLGVLFLLSPSGVPAQEKDRQCVFQLLNVDREGLRVEPLPGIENYYAGGNVRMQCRGQQVRMRADSIALFQGAIAQFIGQVVYEDSTAEMTADFGTYFRDGDRWEARGNVVFTNREDRSTLRGPELDYYRALPEVRPDAELFAARRPTVTITATDSTGADAEPYILVGDRVRIRGNTRFWSGGSVTIDRSDLRAQSDSLELDTGAGESGLLLGRAEIHRLAADSVDLTARRIDFTLDGSEVTYTLAQGNGHLVASGLDLASDTIGIDIEDRIVRQTLAWGDSIRPDARSGVYRVTADSLAIDSPARRLREIRGFGNGWTGFSGSTDTVPFAGDATAARSGSDSLPPRSATDSVTGRSVSDSLAEALPPAVEGDWLAGDTLVLVFDTTAAPAGAEPRTDLETMRAILNARAYYRMAMSDTTGMRSVNYTTADTILIRMKREGDSTVVDRVEASGRVNGVQLQPASTVPPLRLPGGPPPVPRPPSGPPTPGGREGA